jgi:hypothetical protein
MGRPKNDTPRRTFTTSVDGELADRFERWCEQNGTTPYKVLAEAVKRKVESVGIVQKRAGRTHTSIESLTDAIERMELIAMGRKEPDCW